MWTYLGRSPVGPRDSKDVLDTYVKDVPGGCLVHIITQVWAHGKGWQHSSTTTLLPGMSVDMLKRREG
jgi:hypothetical protein